MNFHLLETFEVRCIRRASSDQRAKHDEDRELVCLSQGGDKSAFEQLIRRHQQCVFALVGGILCQTQDVEDVTQRVFLKAYVGIREFDQRAAFSTWLYKIAVNQCWHYSRTKVRLFVFEAGASDWQVSSRDGIASRERVEAKDVLYRTLGSLSDEDRRLLILKEVLGVSLQVLTEILGLDVNTAKVELFRARGRVVDAHRHQVGRVAVAKALGAKESQ